MPKVSERFRARFEGTRGRSAPPRGLMPMDRELVLAARAGETWAAEALYRRHRRMVYSIATRLAHADDRDDLVQDAFVKVLGSLRQLKSPELFASWLAAVVVRTASRTFQRRRAMSRLDTETPIPLERLTSHAPPPDVSADLMTIYRFLALLPVETRLVFIMRRVERMSIDEVAAQLGRSVATVKRRLADAERLLDQRMLRDTGGRAPRRHG